MGAFQSLVAATDITSPTLAGLIVGQHLYGIWIGAVVAITLAGAALARRCLKPTSPRGAAAVRSTPSPYKQWDEWRLHVRGLL